MDYSDIDQLMEQITNQDKVGNENDESQNDGLETSYETDELYTNFVLKEIILGNVSIDDQITTTPPNAVTQPCQKVVQEFGQVAGVSAATIDQPMTLVNHQPNGTFDVFGLNRSANIAATEQILATYQMAGKKMVIPVLSMAVPIPSQEVAIATVPSAVNGPATPGPSGTQKRKLYELEEFNDPHMEKKRRNAINAKNHRDKTKSKIQQLTDELEEVKTARDSFSVDIQLMTAEIEELRSEKAMAVQCQQAKDTLQREIIALREENARLRQQESKPEQDPSLQQEKIGMLDSFDLLPDDLFDF